MASIPVPPEQKGYCLAKCSYPLLPFSCLISVLLRLRISQLSGKNDVPPSPRHVMCFLYKPVRLGQVIFQSPWKTQQSLSFRGRLMPEASRNASPPWKIACFVYVSWRYHQNEVHLPWRFDTKKRIVRGGYWNSFELPSNKMVAKNLCVEFINGFPIVPRSHLTRWKTLPRKRVYFEKN